MTTEFPEEESDSDLCVHRVSVVKAIVLGVRKSRLTPEARWPQSFQNHPFQTSAFIVPLW